MVRYYIGEEKKVVQETKDFENSIFHEQYKQAIRQIAYIMENPQSDIPNLFAFCGDRGEGKTSCMQSVSYLIEHANEHGVKNYLQNVCNYNFGEKKLEILPIIDPAFFDKNHNILELVLGQLYGTYKEWQKKNNGDNYSVMSSVTKLFQKVKFCLRHLTSDKQDEYDPLEELEQLSAGIDLSTNMSKLIAEYLKLIGKDFLVICIDDIDLNMSEAYKMCEELRKYLVSDKCLVLISVKIEQLLIAIENAIQEDTTLLLTDSYVMASKYVDKLIPMSCRINMPKTYSLCEQGLEIYKNREDQEAIFKSRSVKEGIVRKIFYTTRFLFYNSKGSVSPIIPNNLRRLTHLLGLLFSMEEPQDEEILNGNKNTFKSYFYYSWTIQLEDPYKRYALELVSIEDSGKVNKFVINSLRDLCRYKERCLMADIVDISNYNYNISVGDVLYAITNLDQQTVDENVKQYLFFIKSYYSIKLYENYDIITDNAENIYPKPNSDGQLLQYDAWFERVNALQKLVAGAYFSYTPGNILPKKNTTKEYRDYKYISESAYILTNMISTLDKLKTHYPNLNEENKNKFETAFNLAEYFMLSVSRSIYEKDRKSFPEPFRRNAVPSYLTQYNSNIGYYVFDVLAIFYSITNVEYAYNRFDSICTRANNQDLPRESLFEFAKKHDFSLLRQMIEAVIIKNIKDEIISEEDKTTHKIDEDFFFWHHRLLSNATIRNAEVATAVFETIKNSRYKLRSSGESNELLSDFYANIQKTNMATYQKGENESSYSLEFTFLEPIIKLLKEPNIRSSLNIVDDGNTYDLPNFDMLFSSNEQISTITSEESKNRYKNIRDLLNKSTPNMRRSKAENILIKIHNNDSELYEIISESKWNDILSSNDKMGKKDLINKLLPHYELFADLISKRQGYATQPETAEIAQGTEAEQQATMEEQLEYLANQPTC